MVSAGIGTVTSFLALSLVAACRDKSPESARPKVVVSSVSQHYGTTREVTLTQPESTLLVRASGVAFSKDGRIAIGDASEGNIKLYAADGHLLTVLGKKGEGPNEFRAPRWLQFGRDGELLVADAQLERVATFDSTGAYKGQVLLSNLGTLHSFLTDAAGEWVVLASRSDSKNVVHVLDSSGRSIRSYLPIRDVRPKGAQSSQWFRAVADFRFVLRSDTAFVVSTVMDSLWWVDLHSGLSGSVQIPLPDYRQIREPVPDDHIPRNPAGLFQHLKKFHSAAAVAASPTEVVVSFVQGVLNFGDPQVLAIRDRRGDWSIVSDAGPLVNLSHSSVVTLSVLDQSPIGFKLLSEQK